jgi:hypothetical protein
MYSGYDFHNSIKSFILVDFLAHLCYNQIMMWETKTDQFLEWAPQAVKSVFFGVSGAVLATVSLFQPILAQSGVFSWQGETLTYHNRQFTKQSVQGEEGKTFYVAKEGNKAHTLIFNGNPREAKQASYVVYDVNDDNHFTNPQHQTVVSAETDQGTSTAEITNGNNSNNNSNSAIKAIKPEGGSSCSVEGIGWIVCPIMTAISKGLDGMQAVIAGFMDVKPINTDENTLLVKAWQMVRNISNLVFILVFLVIIMSYVTNRGVDNYNVKKTLPKLILGALMVNLSFYICAVAVDLTNIIGHSIVSLFRELQAQTGTTYMEMSWAELTTAILSGGALATAGFGTAVIATGSATGVLLALASALVSALITLVATMVVLSARQALIIILIIVSPLAFVATLMPNTESYFTKWRDMMKKLLLLLPIFSVVYGGSQLAGWIIISSAHNIITILLGMIVQVIPFLILPKLVKDSDSLLGRLSDGLEKTVFSTLRTGSKNTFNRYSDEARQKYLSSEAPRYDYAKRLTQKLDRAKRVSEEKAAAYKKLSDAKYLNLKSGATTGRYASTRLLEQKAEQELENANLELKIINKNHLAKMFLSINKNKKRDIELGLAGYSKIDKEIAKASLMNRVKQSEDLMATGAQSMYYNQIVQKDIDIGEYRGKKQNIIHASTGVFEGTEGSEVSVVSKMLATTKKEYQEELGNYRTAMNVYKLSTDQLKAIVMGDKNNGYKPGKVKGRDDDGNEYEFDGSESAVWEAAAHKLFPYRIDLLTEYLRNTDSVIDKTTNKKYDLAWRTKHSTQIANLIRDHSLGKSATYLGNVSPELIEQGVIGRDNMAAIMLNQIVKGRFGDDEFVSQDKDTIEAIADLIENLDSNIHFNGPEGQFGDGSIGFGIDGLTRDKCIEGMFEYQDILHRALDPKGETFRKLKKAQIKKMRKLDQALSKYTHIPAVK